jgi:hypothetical protein
MWITRKDFCAHISSSFALIELNLLLCDFREWQDLFYNVHSVCLWDEKGAQKIRDSLEDLIVAFIKQAQSRVLIAGEEQALLKAYIIEWRKFFTQSSFLPLPFWQLETSLQVTSSEFFRRLHAFNNCTISDKNIFKSQLQQQLLEKIFQLR